MSANFLTQTRLSQCQIIDKYVDSRVEDYYRERQSCVQQSIQRNGGDMDPRSRAARTASLSGRRATGRAVAMIQANLIASSRIPPAGQDSKGPRAIESPGFFSP